MSEDIAVEIKIRNRNILLRMRKAGISSAAELARMSGARTGAVYKLLNMTLAARGAEGNWLLPAIKLAEFFDCLPGDLFSKRQQWGSLDTNRAEAVIGYSEMAIDWQNRAEAVTPDIALEAKQLRQAISRALMTLTPREERVVRMRFGFEGNDKTLDEIAQMFSITRERIRLIELKALRKLRYGVRPRPMIAAAGVNPNAQRVYETGFDSEIIAALH